MFICTYQVLVVYKIEKSFLFCFFRQPEVFQLVFLHLHKRLAVLRILLNLQEMNQRAGCSVKAIPLTVGAGKRIFLLLSFRNAFYDLIAISTVVGDECRFIDSDS